MHANPGQENLSMSNKRKASIKVNANPELTSTNHSLLKVTTPNKRAAPVGSSPKSLGLPQLSVPSKRMAEIQSKSPQSGVSNEKVLQVENNMNKSHLVVANAGALDSVRVKLKESLSAALALVSQHTTSSTDLEKKSENEAAMTPQNGQPKYLESESSTAQSTNIESVTELCGSSGPYPSNKYSDVENSSQEAPLKDIPGEEASHAWKFVGQDFQAYPGLPGDDAPFSNGFFFKDELLQGNGLSWALELDTQIPEVQDVESTQKDELSYCEKSEDTKEQVDMSPESVASKIELELFKLFGGVNKKYKEKGRSLLFNLKDRNNPELRERVMSGEISPERLCSMTAEELASKELSQWRMAKAEELDHMKVLPDSEGNVRRLVKKTHKGEYQVEFDQDVVVVEDALLNTSVVPGNHKTKSARDARRRKKADEAKEDRVGQCRITIPSDGADMQGLMVDDMRYLPPIVSLDEFMESLDKEPPFENMSVDPETTTPILDKENTEVNAEPISSAPPLADPVQSILQNKEMSAKSVKPDAEVMSSANRRRIDTNMGHRTSMEHFWEGLLQINLSSMAPVMAIYKSGEKASTKDWPNFFEIKGRVRLDPFDKFLQELPMSRNRAIMVAHFVLKSECMVSESSNLMELIDSYSADQRLGFAEPTPGAELYLCAPNSKPVELVVKHLPKEYTEKINDISIGLIGILVWKKEHVINAGPPNTSQHKFPAKVQPLTVGRQHPVKDTIHTNVNFASRVAPPTPSLSSPTSNDDLDVPPGFGPSGGTGDDDDLPEFNFSGSLNPSRSHISYSNPHSNQEMDAQRLRPGGPARQVEQIRELIQRYGHGGGGGGNRIPVLPWKNDDDDDDDDMPEWEPHHAHQPQQPLPPPSGHLTQNLSLMPRVNQPFLQPPLVPLAKPMQPLQPPMTGHGTWWPPSANNMPPPGSVGGQHTGGHLSREWRPPNASGRNRGF